MKLIFVGADHEVTGSCHYLEAAGVKVLVDYGMEQGTNIFENVPLPVSAKELDYVLLTHAHVDHTGLLPRLYKEGYDGPIYCTSATAGLSAIMLRDCAHIQEQEQEWESRKAKRGTIAKSAPPEFTTEDAENAIAHLVPCDYDNIIELNDELRIRFRDIGHLLGSAAIEIWAQEEGRERKICFSGDVGNLDQPLIRDPGFIDEADYVIMESTYGDRRHEVEKDTNRIQVLADIIQKTLDRGGNVVIPSFAVGRTQELLFFLRVIKEEKMVTGHGDFPVYVDSPMAVEATRVFLDNKTQCFDEEAMSYVKRGIDPCSFPSLRTAVSSEESKAINFDQEPKVIISSSGMCDAGRIRHHLKHNLWRPESTILFAGYQSQGTLGRRLVDGATSVKLFEETIDVRAEIRVFSGLSGHADRDGLIRWITGFKNRPKRVFLVHGEDQTAINFGRLLEQEYGFSVSVPYSGTEFDLMEDRITYAAKPKPIKKKNTLVMNDKAALKAALDRLSKLADEMNGRPAAEIRDMTEAINALYGRFK